MRLCESVCHLKKQARKNHTYLSPCGSVESTGTKIYFGTKMYYVAPHHILQVAYLKMVSLEAGLGDLQH